MDQVLGFNGLIYTTSTEFKGRNIPKCESDFIAIPSRRNHDGKIEIIIGECKSLKGEITQDDILKLNAIAESFPTDKFAVYIVFSKLGQFSSHELSNISHQNRKGRAVIFSPRELGCSMLLSSNLYEDLRRELGCGTLYSGNLKEMAEITQQFILSNPTQGYPANYTIKHVENTKIAFHQSALKLKTMSDSFNFQGSDRGEVLGRVPDYKFTYLFNNH